MMTQEEINDQLLTIMNDYKKFNNQKFNELLKLGADINLQNKDGLTPLMYPLKYYGSIYIDDTNFYIELLKKCDVNIRDNQGYNILMYIADGVNKDTKLIKTIYKNIDLIYDLCKKSNMNIHDFHSSETLFFNILSNQELAFSQKQLKDLFNRLNKRNQQMVFKNVCLFLALPEFQKEQEKNLLFLLYDCNIIVSNQTKKWIEKKGFQNIIQMIEKRDVLIMLHKDLNNKEKYMNTINYKI